MRSETQVGEFASGVGHRMLGFGLDGESFLGSAYQSLQIGGDFISYLISLAGLAGAAFHTVIIKGGNSRLSGRLATLMRSRASMQDLI